MSQGFLQKDITLYKHSLPNPSAGGEPLRRLQQLGHSHREILPPHLRLCFPTRYPTLLNEATSATASPWPPSTSYCRRRQFWYGYNRRGLLGFMGVGFSRLNFIFIGFSAPVVGSSSIQSSQLDYAGDSRLFSRGEGLIQSSQPGHCKRLPKLSNMAKVGSRDCRRWLDGSSLHINAARDVHRSRTPFGLGIVFQVALHAHLTTPSPGCHGGQSGRYDSTTTGSGLWGTSVVPPAHLRAIPSGR